MLGSMLNFSVRPFHFSNPALICQAAVALGVPVLAALAPIWNGTRITVREAISSYGLATHSSNPNRQGLSRIDRLAEKAAFFSRPVLLSLRNTFGRKARLALTLITLTLGGAIFISVFNLWAAFRGSINEVQQYYLANVTVDFNRPYSLSKITPLIETMPNVTGVEGWDSAMGSLLSADVEKDLEIIINAQPNGSKLVQPAITSGRWLLPTDENAIVIGNHVLNERPDLKTGDSVVIKINEKETSWVIVGTFRIVGNFNPAPVYVNYAYLDRLINLQGKVSSLRIITAPQDSATEARAASLLETVFKKNNIQIANIRQGEAWREQQVTSYDVMIYFLLVMAILIALVGGLGLMGTMSMNVMERSREIGVLRAVGASNGSIFQMVLVEVLLIGWISWILGFFLSIPVTYLLDMGVGLAVFRQPMGFQFGLDGVLIWLVGMLVIAGLAGALPAWNAMRLTIREVLAYV